MVRTATEASAAAWAEVEDSGVVVPLGGGGVAAGGGKPGVHQIRRWKASEAAARDRAQVRKGGEYAYAARDSEAFLPPNAESPNRMP